MASPLGPAFLKTSSVLASAGVHTECTRQASLGNNFRVARRGKIDETVVQWDPDKFVKPSASAAPAQPRRRIPGAPKPKPSRVVLLRDDEHSASFKKPAPRDLTTHGLDDEDWPKLSVLRKVMSEPTFNRRIEVKYSAIGWMQQRDVAVHG